MKTEFKLGKLVVTENIAARMKTDHAFNHFVDESLERFIKRDWGDVCPVDRAAANEAVDNGSMVMGVYKRQDAEIWIITEWDRSTTTILFPSEY